MASGVVSWKRDKYFGGEHEAADAEVEEQHRERRCDEAHDRSAPRDHRDRDRTNDQPGRHRRARAEEVRVAENVGDETSQIGRGRDK